MMHASFSSRVRRLPSLPLLVLVFITYLASSALGAVYVFPPEPTERDSISIEVVHGFADGCWTLTGHTCASVAGDSIAIDVYVFDLEQYGWTCPQGVWSYSYTCDYGLLPVGVYTVTFTEYHDSLRWPEPRIDIVGFEVRPDTPIERTSWGRIRALYR